MLQLLDEAQAFVRDRWNPSAFNIGVNDGPAAGQTIGHLHMHLIPRFDGDVPDPRGGVRWVLPEKADYWTKR
jgi:diadenosine tetraphosphate (Ap4A) HIT family hydrolase